MLATRVTEEAVRAVPEPRFTDSWHPMAHYKVLDVLDSAITSTGIEIVKKNYSLSADKTNVFWTWTLSQVENGLQWMVGGRNSISKCFALGITAGNWITVCSNMNISGDYLEFRRHTGHLDYNELQELIGRAMTKLIDRLTELTRWHIGLKEYPLYENSYSFKALTFDAMRAGAFPSSKFKEFLTCIEEERMVDSDHFSLYNFHGACTRLMRENSLFNIAHRSVNIKTVLDDYIDAKVV